MPQAVRRELGSHPLLDAGRGGAMGTDTYHRALRGAEWCLTAPGFGFGARLVDYVACGCIPVVVRPGQGQLWLPYEPELDYRTFAVSLPFEDIPRLPALLEAIPPAVLRAKREALRALHRRFLWDDEYGQAFEAVREAVLLKVK